MLGWGWEWGGEAVDGGGGGGGLVDVSGGGWMDDGTFAYACWIFLLVLLVDDT